MSNDKQLYNITRTQGRDVTIFMRDLTEKDAKTQLKHWKNLARNSGGHVYFNMVAVPPEVKASMAPVEPATEPVEAAA